MYIASRALPTRPYIFAIIKLVCLIDIDVVFIFCLSGKLICGIIDL